MTVRDFYLSRQREGRAVIGRASVTGCPGYRPFLHWIAYVDGQWLLCHTSVEHVLPLTAETDMAELPAWSVNRAETPTARDRWKSDRGYLTDRSAERSIS